MAKLERDTPHGRLVVEARTPEAAEAAFELASRDLVGASVGLDRVAFDGDDAWFKRSWLRGGARARWTVKTWLGARVPRVAEYHNLRWLAERLFEAPTPLAAGCVSRGGAPAWQFLLTRDVPEAATLDEFLDQREHADRADVLEEVARETARLHALGFVHHDLYPRNVLVRRQPERASNVNVTSRRIVFLDAWAGGPPPQSRGVAYDLACFLLRADTQLDAREIASFTESYTAHRAAQARPVDAERLMRDARSIRRAMVQRLIRRPHELRGRPAPRLEL